MDFPGVALVTGGASGLFNTSRIGMNALADFTQVLERQQLCSTLLKDARKLPLRTSMPRH
jgi:hypothetical protein